MELLADVHVKSAYVNALTARGHDVIRVQDVLPQDASDAEVIDYARAGEFVMLTNDDKDFSRFGSHPGVLFVPQDMQPADVGRAVSRVERQFDSLTDTVQYLRDWI